jgi:hypothetical protein
MIERQLPDLEFGFRKGRSIFQTTTLLLKDTEEALMLPRGKLLALCIL